MLEKFNKFRFWLAIKFIMLALNIMNKKSIEYISFIVAIENWIKWLQETTMEIKTEDGK